MLYFLKNEAGQVVEAVAAIPAGADRSRYTYRGEFKSMTDAAMVAGQLGDSYIAVDKGSHTSPRYDVVRRPHVGDEVSYGFNGDYYPCGVVTKISESLRIVATSTGDVFYRRKQTGSWIRKGGTWSLVNGRLDLRNPEF